MASRGMSLDQLQGRDFCYGMLNKVSRSFALVIQQLPFELRDPICIFYLVLRGLDTVEDDMKIDMKQKAPLLQNFHEIIEKDGWNIKGIGDTKDYILLMEQFDKVIAEYKKLKPGYKAAIKDITKKMGKGMCDFAEKMGVDSLEEWDLYCHYVAGLVGHGLSALFSASGLEEKSLAKELDISNTMGLFLQKTNIIRDYLEDLEEGRIFWPKAVWSKYAKHLSQFADKPDDKVSLAALNELVTNALAHIPGCLKYMRMIQNPMNFRFCAIPQVMAIATLAEVYNNTNVFKGVVKIRKGLSCKIILETNDFSSVRDAFRYFLNKIKDKIPKDDPNAPKTLERVKTALRLLGPSTGSGICATYTNAMLLAGTVASSYYLYMQF
uniref:Squalene synthase n=1 Tax=Lotharella globosa TaxID=91324 RepID=A0A6U3CCN3_9EUKA